MNVLFLTKYCFEPRFNEYEFTENAAVQRSIRFKLEFFFEYNLNQSELNR